jgi:division protein CdvB (Snf7/Vps24/ESCRT-III family)
MHSSPPPLREIALHSIQILKIQRNKIEQASYRLRERDRILFQSCVGALKTKNKDRASICANEISEVRKLINFLNNVELAIERVILRLETIKELSDIVIDLKPALRLLQSVSQDLSQLLPDVSSELNSVNDTISETLYSTKLTADESTIPVNRKTPGGEEVLCEVTSFLERKISQDLPEPPIAHQNPVKEPATLEEMLSLAASNSDATSRIPEESRKDSSPTLFSYRKSEIKEISLKVENPDLENILLDYVRKSNGRIDMERCSVDLETSNEDIEKALESLGSKGKIKIEVKAGE